MFRILLSAGTTLAVCTPLPEDAAMRPATPDPHSITATADAPIPDDRSTAARSPGDDHRWVVQGPMPPPVSVSTSGGPAPVALPDTAAEAEGRRILSTAFVRIGPDGQLTVELHDGRALTLRDVTMGPRKYCGVDVTGGPSGARRCGRYAEVAAARPGGVATPQTPDPDAGRKMVIVR